jgi:hypothetical protein
MYVLILKGLVWKLGDLHTIEFNRLVSRQRSCLRQAGMPFGHLRASLCRSLRKLTSFLRASTVAKDYGPK